MAQLKMKMMMKISDLLSHFEIECYESNGLLVSSCPIHGGNNQTAFNINIDEDSEDHYGKWFCNTNRCHYSKGGNDIISFVWMMLEKKSNAKVHFRDVLKFCEQFCEGLEYNGSFHFTKKDPIDILLRRSKVTNEKKRFNRDQVRRQLEFPARFYMDAPRNFSEQALNFFDVGVCRRKESRMYNRIVFPVYDEDDRYMVGCTGRTIVNSTIKWLNQEGFSKANFLYNYGKAIHKIKTCGTIILVEGQGDVIRLWEAGIHNAVGMFGSSLSDAQEFLIQKTGVCNVVAMPDNDSAGQICLQDIKKKLGSLFNVTTVVYEKKDIGEMSVDEINQIIKPQLGGKF